MTTEHVVQWPGPRLGVGIASERARPEGVPLDPVFGWPVEETPRPGKPGGLFGGGGG